MERESELAIVRRAYAKQIMAAAGVEDRRVEAALAAVRREQFLGPGPWPILRWGRGYVPTPSRDPAYLYADVLVGIIPERDLNNGLPSFLAALIAAGKPVVPSLTTMRTASGSRPRRLSAARTADHDWLLSASVAS